MLSRILASNFQSWKSLEFTISKGVTLVDGWNEDDQIPEGSGKSAVFNAMVWALYGKIPKDANIDDVIKWGEESCSVMLEFDDGTVISRSRKPNEVVLKQDGKIVKGKDAKETQQKIQDYIGRTFESFCQTSYFAQNYSKKFLDSNQEDKGKILSDVQGILVFDKARKEVQELLKVENNKVSTLENQLKVEIANQNNIRSQRKLINDFIQRKRQDHQTNFNNLKFKYDSLLKNVETQTQNLFKIEQSLQTVSLDSLIQYQESLQNQKIELSVKSKEALNKRNQVVETNRSITNKQSEGQRYANRYKTISSKKEQLTAYMENPTKNCPSCGTELKNIDTTHVQKELSEIESEMTQILQTLEDISKFLDSNPIQTNQELSDAWFAIEDQLKQIDQNLKANKSSMDQYQFQVNSATNLRSQLSSYEMMAQDLKSQMDTVTEPDVSKELLQLGTLDQQEQTLSEKVNHLQQIYTQTKHYANQLEQLKDGFKEIKSYVFNSALNELSFRANEFLRSLFHVPAQIKFTNQDLQIETKILLNERETSIGLLSGGQSRRFNLAIDLALSDMVSSRQNSKVGVLILDEYFKDLSEASMEKCLDLLKLRKSPVLLIEHNSIFKSIVDNTFFAKLEKGTSSESRE